METCEVCGFAWASVGDAEIPRRVRSGAEAALRALDAAGDGAAVRPSPDRWSPLEYAGHLRDVCLHLRDRVVIALAEDTPSFKPLHRDARVDAGLYVGDRPDLVATELRIAADLFARTIERIGPGAFDRPCIYAYPTESVRTLRWLGQQVVHELDHHTADMVDDVHRPGR